jgi:hypothetical protein
MFMADPDLAHYCTIESDDSKQIRDLQQPSDGIPYLQDSVTRAQNVRSNFDTGASPDVSDLRGSVRCDEADYMLFDSSAAASDFAQSAATPEDAETGTASLESKDDVLMWTVYITDDGYEGFAAYRNVFINDVSLADQEITSSDLSQWASQMPATFKTMVDNAAKK